MEILYLNILIGNVQTYEMLCIVDVTIDAFYSMEGNLKKENTLTKMNLTPNFLLSHSLRKTYVLPCSSIRRQSYLCCVRK